MFSQQFKVLTKNSRYILTKQFDRSLSTNANLACVDVGSLFSSELRYDQLTIDQEKVVESIGNASSTIGFMYLKNSPLTHLMPYMDTASKWFFDQELNKKNEIRSHNTQRGYHHFLGSPHTISLDSVKVDSNTGIKPIVGAHNNVDHIEAYTMQSPWNSNTELKNMYMEDESLIESTPHFDLLLDKYHYLINREIKLNNTGSNNIPQFSSTPMFGMSNFGTSIPNQTEYNRWPVDSFTPIVFDVPYMANPPSTALSQEEIDLSTRSPFTEHLPSFPLKMDANLFRSICASYFAACTITGEALTAALGLYLKVNPHNLVYMHDTHNHTLEMKKYPVDNVLSRSSETTLSTFETSSNNVVNKSDSNQDDIEQNNWNTNDILNSLDQVRLRMPLHSDLSSVTLLTQTHDTGGLLLNILNEDQQRLWLRAPYKKGHVIVNTGDFIEKMTNSRIKSTLHCVASVDKKIQLTDRYSTVFFYQPDMHAYITPLFEKDFVSFQAGDIYPYFD